MEIEEFKEEVQDFCDMYIEDIGRDIEWKMTQEDEGILFAAEITFQCRFSPDTFAIEVEEYNDSLGIPCGEECYFDADGDGLFRTLFYDVLAAKRTLESKVASLRAETNGVVAKLMHTAGGVNFSVRGAGMDKVREEPEFEAVLGNFIHALQRP